AERPQRRHQVRPGRDRRHAGQRRHRRRRQAGDRRRHQRELHGRPGRRGPAQPRRQLALVPGARLGAAGRQRPPVRVPRRRLAGQDYLAAWDPPTGQLRPGWPRPVNDLQFITGPSIADVDPSTPGEEVVSGTSSDDLQGFSSLGTDLGGWPKLTGDWTVANPLIGSFGTLDTSPDARRVVIGMTRAGQIFGYGTSAPACAPASWPRF